jgi:ERF superfamily
MENTVTESKDSVYFSQMQLYKALAAAQGQFQPIGKNRSVQIATKTGGSYRFEYADLEEILSKTRPALSQNGLALIQTVEQGERGQSLVCSLLHASGGVIRSEIPLPSVRDIGDPKSFGAAMTYLRRYLVTAILGVAADDDLDEDGQESDTYYQLAEKNTDTPRTKPPVATPQRKAAPPAQPAAEPSGELATPGEVAYLHKKLDGRSDAPEICEAHGLGYDLAGLTKAQFASMKAALV